MMKYLEVENFIVRNINSGVYAPNVMILSENQLAEKFKVSRMTARKAISNLVARNILYQIMGRGTFVVNHDEKMEIFLDSSSDFSDRALKEGKKPTTVLLNFKEKIADNIIAKKLKLGDDHRVLCIERLRCIDDKPVILEITYIPHNVYKDMTEEDIEIAKYKYVKYIELNGRKIDRTVKEFSGVLPENKVHNILKIDNQMPVFKVDVTYYFTSGDVFEYSKVYYNQTEYKFIQVTENKI